MTADRDSAGERLAAHAPRLRLLCVHLLGGALRRRIEVDDLVQETFARALASERDWPRMETGDEDLARYLARIARHAAIDAARAARASKRSGREERLARSDWSVAGPRESEIAARSAGPSTRAAAAESAERVERAFAALAPEHRRVIALRQLEGLSAADAALRMGRSETAVHSLYRRALLAWETAARSRDGSTGDRTSRA